MKRSTTLGALAVVLAVAVVTAMVQAAAPSRAASVAMESASQLVQDVGENTTVFTSPAYPEVRHVSLTVREPGLVRVPYRILIYSPSYAASGQPGDALMQTVLDVFDGVSHTIEFDTTQWTIYCINDGNPDTNPSVGFEFSYTVTYPAR